MVSLLLARVTWMVLSTSAWKCFLLSRVRYPLNMRPGRDHSLLGRSGGRVDLFRLFSAHIL